MGGYTAFSEDALPYSLFPIFDWLFVRRWEILRPKLQSGGSLGARVTIFPLSLLGASPRTTTRRPALLGLNCHTSDLGSRQPSELSITYRSSTIFQL